ncbi:MAG: hypothetical protein AUJ57_07905 [Zetaproteobacteria bacterium CG1_02_53_45]|nr:MAG: hypothetical protein AUJ57_07905 [Zetaproteobacteria bacterium CG1_02_53_45]
MIEPTNSTGLTGTSVKAGKQAKNGLFSKLMSMLNKNTQGEAKGLLAASKGTRPVSITESSPMSTKKGVQVHKLIDHSLVTKQQSDENNTSVATVLFVAGQSEALAKSAKGEPAVATAATPASKGKKANFSSDETRKPTTVAQGKTKAAAAARGEQVIAAAAKTEASAPAAKAGQVIAGASKTEASAPAAKAGQVIAAAAKTEASAPAAKGEQVIAAAAKTEASAPAAKDGQLIAAAAKTEASASAPAVKAGQVIAAAAKTEASATAPAAKGGQIIAAAAKTEASAPAAKDGQVIAAAAKTEASAPAVKAEPVIAAAAKTGTSAPVAKGDQALVTPGKAEFAEHTEQQLLTNPVHKNLTSAKAETATSKLMQGQEAPGQAAAAGLAQTDEEKEAPVKSTIFNDAEQKSVASDKNKNHASPFAAALQASNNAKNTPAQVQQTASQTSISAAEQGITVSDASTSDSNGQSSDRGHQDGRTMSAMGSEARSGTTSAAGNTQFQSYLSNKTAPAMSIFDSMNHVAQSASNGQTKLEIQLDPLHLGKIQISLQTDANKHLQVHMIVDQGTTRAAIEQQLPALKAALAQQGLDLSGFSMGSRDQGQGYGSENGSHRSSFQSANNDSGITEIQSTQQPGRTSEGRLSILA